MSRSSDAQAGRNQPEWMRTLRAGDVLVDRNGTYRVVRKACYRRTGVLWGCYFAIRRCSWTGRPTTVKTWVDMRNAGMVKVEGVRVKLATDLDRAIEISIENYMDRSLTCCAVRGIY